MARHEQSREDLIRDARALVERVELTVPDSLCTDLVVVGRRASGDLSLYFGEDPVFHFNATGQLRRAYVAGRLLKAEATKLVAMDRRRIEGEVQLHSRTLTAAESQTLTSDLTHKIDELARAINSGTATITRTVGEATTIDNVVAWLVPLQSKPIEIAPRPNVG